MKIRNTLILRKRYTVLLNGCPEKFEIIGNYLLINVNATVKK
jgi:hypothetical protein